MRTHLTGSLLPFPANPQPGELPFPVEDPRGNKEPLPRVAPPARSARPLPEVHRYALKCWDSGDGRELVPMALKEIAHMHHQGFNVILHWRSEIGRLWFYYCVRKLSESDRAEIRAFQALSALESADFFPRRADSSPC